MLIPVSTGKSLRTKQKIIRYLAGLLSCGPAFIFAPGGLIGQSCGGLIGQSCGGLIGQSCGGLIGQSCGGLIGQSCGGLIGQSCGGLVKHVKKAPKINCTAWEYSYIGTL